MSTPAIESPGSTGAENQPASAYWGAWESPRLSDFPTSWRIVLSLLAVVPSGFLFFEAIQAGDWAGGLPWLISLVVYWIGWAILGRLLWRWLESRGEV